MRITVTVPDDVVARIEAAAHRHDRSRSSMVRVLLTDALNHLDTMPTAPPERAQQNVPTTDRITKR
jgi:metal-responsive CopG/Arc/MetJ family transcriptional regulator